MKWIVQLLLFLNHFSVGLLAPVLNLMLLDRGASYQTLPLLYMVMAAVILLFEIPSGICADMIGRKRVFLLSGFFNTISFILLYLAKESIILLFVSIALYGIGRAFASGSLDALIIDQAVAKHGNQGLPRITARLSILEAVGLSLGSICGGFLAHLGEGYSVNLIIRTVSIILVMGLAALFTEEVSHTSEIRLPFKEHIREGIKIVISSKAFAIAIAGGFIVGIALSSVETYWQPAFIQVSGSKESNWMLGIIMFLGFSAVSGGNFLAQRILTGQDKTKFWIHILSRGFLGASLVLFALQTSKVGYILLYTIFYLILGLGNIAELTIINSLTPSSIRASILSLYSFVIQIGLMVSSLISSLSVQWVGFAGVWVIMAIITGMYVISSIVVNKT